MVLFLRDSERVPSKRLVYKEEFMGKGMHFRSLESNTHMTIYEIHDQQGPTEQYRGWSSILCNNP